ncbi:MAG: ABC transporter permease [Oscillospiraceae bacterium]|nr:ABC transporter permease [Oscillospiraceae bacterium]
MNENIKHQGRIAQTGIYLGKLFRLFVFQSDWKVLPMSAVIAALVSLVVAQNLNKTMEGTLMGAFAISCICIWNGCFNSIQSVCRERSIVKREHRAGLHMTAYVAANMIYQAVVCLAQSVITIQMMKLSKVAFPGISYVTGNPALDMLITIFLIHYSADILSLFVSSVVRSTTTAMTVMPFILIFQLIFSGGFFSLSEKVMPVTNATVSKWGLTALCSEGNYNDLPMVSLWNSLFAMKDTEIEGVKPYEIMIERTKDISDEDIDDLVEGGMLSQEDAAEIRKYREEDPDYAGELFLRAKVMQKTAESNYKPQYVSTRENIIKCWTMMAMFALIFGILSVVALEFIDKDKR